MLADGFRAHRLIPIENKTVVTNPREGCRNNRWEPVLDRHGLTFTPLTEVEWRVYPFKSPLLKLNDIFPEGIQIPAIYPGRQILHLPTVKTHGHAVMTGSVKNSFGGLLQRGPALRAQVHARSARRSCCTCSVSCTRRSSP